MSLRSLLLLAAAVAVARAHFPLQPEVIKPRPIQEDVGEPLYLTEYIERGDIDGARQAALVTEPLEGVDPADQPNSYAGFFTTNEDTDSNIFFWFFEATEVDPANAPVVIWLQGGPGSSSLFGAFELHGPIIAVDDGNGDVTGLANEFAWTDRANMLYIDNPVGAGYSYSDPDGLPETQEDAMNDLYPMLVQFFTVFAEYQTNEFYTFGESYAGKWVPSIARRIHEENEAGAEVQINLAGLGIGDGFMSPEETAVYAEFLYGASLVDEPTRDDLLQDEQNMKDACAAGDWDQAFNIWNAEFNTFLGAMGCNYYYEIRQCRNDPEEDNYADYVQLESTRLAAHVGDRPFGTQSGAVYNSMRTDFMQSAKADIEFLINLYPVLIYDGNMDIICNHYGILEMFRTLDGWDDHDEYLNADREVFRGDDGETAGYLTSVGNLRMIVMRNAGHMVPRSQPVYAQEMFEKFLDGDL